MDYVLLVKIISNCLYPLGLFLLLHVFAMLTRWLKWRSLSRTCAILAWLIILLASNPMIASKLVRSLEQQHPQQALTDIDPHDAILVLGGGLRAPQPPALYTQLTDSSDRYWHATRLYKAGKAKLILLAGGNVFEQPGIKSEAFYAARLLQQWGVPREAIKIETHSRTTEQNMRNIQLSLNAYKVNSVLLVTSAYHMPRALYTLDADRISVTPATADILIRQVSRPVWLRWLPSSSALGLSTVALHEYYGIAFMRMKRMLSLG